LLEEARVIDVSDENVSRRLLLLEVTLQAKRLVSFVEQSLVDRTVRRMANDTALTDCLVLVDERAALLGVALEASFVSAQESKAAAFECLLNVRSATLDCDADVRVVAIRAAHFPLEHRVMMRQLKLCAHFEVTLETSFRRLARIDDRVRRAAALHVQTPRPVARLASYVLRVLSMRLETRMRRGPKIACDIFVASLASFRADEFRAGNLGRR
jgi:hypothetical protein